MKPYGGPLAVILCAVASATLQTSPGASAQEQFRELWRVGNWNGFLFTTPSAHFDRCTAVVHYTNGYTLGFSVDRNAQIAMRVTSAELTPTRVPAQEPPSKSTANRMGPSTAST